jgi:hypothetical protein
MEIRTMNLVVARRSAGAIIVLVVTMSIYRAETTFISTQEATISLQQAVIATNTNGGSSSQRVPTLACQGRLGL